MEEHSEKPDTVILGGFTESRTYLYVFERSTIEKQEITVDLIKLWPWVQDPLEFVGRMHRVVFTLSGYDTDFDEHFSEIEKYFQMLTAEWKYLFHFCVPEQERYRWLLELLYSRSQEEISLDMFPRSEEQRFLEEWLGPVEETRYQFSILPDARYIEGQRIMIHSVKEFFGKNQR